MTRLTHLCVTAFSILMLPDCLAVFPAYAGAMEDAVPAIRTFGLLGTWAPDCSKPMAPDNPRVRYFIAAEPETVAHTFSTSPAGAGSSDIAVYAEIVADDRLIIVLRKSGTPTTMGILQRVSGRIRIFDALGSDGKQLVTNGIVAATPQPSAVYQRCQD